MNECMSDSQMWLHIYIQSSSCHLNIKIKSHSMYNSICSIYGLNHLQKWLILGHMQVNIPFMEQIHHCLCTYTLWRTCEQIWKDPPCLMGKLANFLWPCSTAMLVITRGYPIQIHSDSFGFTENSPNHAQIHQCFDLTKTYKKQ